MKSPSNYNIRVGGSGGFSSDEAKLGRLAANLSMEKKYGIDWRKMLGKIGAKHLERTRHDPRRIQKAIEQCHKNRLLANSDAAILKRKQTMKERGHSQKEKNSQFGTIWITNPNTFENKKIKKEK